MRSLQNHKPTIAVFAGLSLVGALAGCSSTAGATSGDSAQTPKTDAVAPSGVTYADGTYTESGSYQSPNGTETVDVTITLGSGVVTAVKVVGRGESRNSQHYQSEFANGIAPEVLGKNIASLKVSKVAGSSLTSGGFNSAVDAIKADATS